MKTELTPRARRLRHHTGGLLLDLTVAVLLLAAVMALSSCTVTIDPDGSKSATVDGRQIARALEIYATK